MVIVYIAAAILILGVMIAIHELGHYLAAKAVGIKVTEFAIGFGPAIFKRQSKKTGEIFSLRWIPLGGFCAFEGQNDFELPPERKKDEAQEEVSLSSLVEQERAKNGEYPLARGMAYDQAHPWRRLVVLFAGAFFNFVSAILFSVVLLMVVGYTQGVRVNTMFDFTHQDSAIVNNIADPNNPGHIGLLQGDVILAVNGQEFTLLNGFGSRLAGLQAGDTPRLTILRDGVETHTYVTIGLMSVDGQAAGRPAVGIYTGIPEGRTDVVPADMVFRPMGFFAAIGRAFLFAFELAWLILSFLWMLISGQIGLSGIGGPISTITVMAENIGASFLNILILVPLISVNLAVFNLLPIPALDGARMIFVGIEWVRKKPINPNLEAKIHMVGLILLMSAVVLLDISFLFGGGRGMLELFGRWRL